MSPIVRRDVLRATAAAGSLGLAGCSASSRRRRETPRDSGEPVEDFEVTFARDARGEPVFERRPEDEGRLGGFEYLTSARDRDRIAFRESSAGERLRRFVDATDLETRSVYLLQRAVVACYRVALVRVTREEDGVEADFCRELRPADAACGADDRVAVGVAIRLPFAGDEFSSLGSGWSSDCDRRPVLAREVVGDG